MVKKKIIFPNLTLKLYNKHMNIWFRKLRGLILIVVFLFLSLLNFFQTEIVLFYDVNIYFIPVLNFLFGLLVLVIYLTLNKEKDELENEFTSVVNHTFRTPLTSIGWMVKELEEDLPKEEKLNLLQKINNSTKKIIDIVDLFVGIKDLNNTASYKFEATSIRDIIEKIIPKYREEIKKKNINLNISTFKDIPLLTLDLNKISFVIDSLLENSLFYTQKNGNILIDAKFENDLLTILVKDDGIGFDDSDKTKVFTKFFRNKDAVLMNPNGMGLKLYLSKTIIKRHKGNIEVKSEGKNKGSSVYITIPLLKKK